MKVKSITQTCSACPSQWEGTLDDGRMFYARYRWGNLSIELSKGVETDILTALGNSVVLYDEIIGGEYDGVLSQSELVRVMEDLGFIFN